MEEYDWIRELDKKALEQQYIVSYHYSAPQKIVALLALFILLVGMITGLVFLVLNVVNLFIK